MAPRSIDQSDLDHIFDRVGGLWEDLRGKRLLLTGGTGTFGCWLLASFLDANRRLNLGAQVTILTRNAEGFRAKVPHYASDPAVTILTGDVRSFDYPDGEFTHIIHAATDASRKMNLDEPLLMLDTVVEGGRHVLEFAARCGAQRFLFTSSAAIYGRQPPHVTHISEDQLFGPDPMAPDAAYGEGKRLTEAMSAMYARKYGFAAVSARCYAVTGPYVPIDGPFAVGNFVRDALAKKPIVIDGDGTPYRSFLYMSDLTLWLWTLLFRGESCRAYNVGSDQELTIADLAREVAVCADAEPAPVHVLKQATPGKPAERLVPSIERARRELGLQVEVDLRRGIQKMMDWYR